MGVNPLSFRAQCIACHNSCINISGHATLLSQINEPQVFLLYRVNPPTLVSDFHFPILNLSLHSENEISVNIWIGMLYNGSVTLISFISYYTLLIENLQILALKTSGQYIYCLCEEIKLYVVSTTSFVVKPNKKTVCILYRSIVFKPRFDCSNLVPSQVEYRPSFYF